MKYQINDKFFDVIETEAQAYFFGLLLADGCNNIKDGVVSIDLQDSDIKILQELTRLVQPEKPIKIYNNKYSVHKRARVVLANRNISNILERKGMVKQKSYQLKEVNGVPDELMHHFIRGYFDGNGSIGIFGAVQNVEFNIVSTRTFLTQIQNILIEKCQLSRTKFGKRHKDRIDEIYHLKYTGRHSCQRIREYLYKDATYYLERKHKKFYSIPETKTIKTAA